MASVEKRKEMSAIRNLEKHGSYFNSGSAEMPKIGAIQNPGPARFKILDSHLCMTLHTK